MPVFFKRGDIPPKSNAERQRRFREEHPGYYQRLHAERRAAVKALSAQRVTAAVTIAVKAQPLALPAPPVRLALPAPVEVLVFPALKTIEVMCVPAQRQLQPTAS